VNQGGTGVARGPCSTARPSLLAIAVRLPGTQPLIYRILSVAMAGRGEGLAVGGIDTSWARADIPAIFETKTATAVLNAASVWVRGGLRQVGRKPGGQQATPLPADLHKWAWADDGLSRTRRTAHTLRSGAAARWPWLESVIAAILGGTLTGSAHCIPHVQIVGWSLICGTAR
jgi:hypothetical protein